MAQVEDHHHAYDGEQRDPDWEAPLRQHHRQQHAEQSHHRTDREFDATGDDHQSQSDTEDPERADLPREVLQIDDVQKVWIDGGRDDTEDNEQYEYAELFFHKRLSFSAGGQTHHDLFAELWTFKNSR